MFTFDFFLSFLASYEFHVFFNFHLFFKVVDNSFVSGLPASVDEYPDDLETYVNTESAFVETLKESPQEGEEPLKLSPKDTFLYKKYLILFFFKQKRFFNRLKNLTYGTRLLFKNFFCCFWRKY